MGSNCCKAETGRAVKGSSIYTRSRAGASLDDRFTVTDGAGGVRLTVTSARSSDSGVYTLQASNAAGRDTARIRLEVSDEPPSGDDPPTFLRRLQDLTVKVGTRTRFLVEVVSSNECKVTWYRNERRLMEAERVSLVRDGNFWCLDVAAVSVDDAGRWTCAAENKGGRASCSAHLNVLVPKAYKRPEFIEELRAILTEQGTVSLECKVVGVPTPVLRWFKDSREIKAGDVFALTASAEDPTSLGTYTCEAVNCMGRAYSSSKVHVTRGKDDSRPSSAVTPEPPPIFTKELEDQFVKICDHLTLGCHIVVPPWPRSVVWYNKEGKVDPSERYHVTEDGVGGYLLEVQSAEWPDEGEWKCVATSAGGRVGISTCHVIMDVPKNYRKPRFMENLQAVLTDEGLVSFECKVVGFPTPVLSWFKDGQELKPGDVYQLTGTNSLGSYCCIARNCMGQASSSAELTVEDIQNQLNEEEKLQLFSKNQAPKFVQGLKSVEAMIDEPFRFTIRVAIPPEPSVLWYRDDQPVDESSRCHLAKEDRGIFTLDIQNLEFLDQAEWKCVAMNDYGHSVTSCFLKLIIPRHYKKPRFLENLQAILSEEGAVNLECKVIGVPQPILKWYKDGEELKPGDIHRIISGQDGTCCLGTYTCEAQNCMGIAASSASLLGFDDSMKVKKKIADEQALQRNLSLSTIHEERTSQMYDTPVGDITLDDKGEISFSFDGKEVSVSLYETPDLTEEEALQIVEMYADQLSENVTEHNVVELPPLRFVKETSTSGNLLMEAIIIDVSPEYFASPEEDLRTEADVEDISIADENGPPQLSLDTDLGEDYLEKTMALLSDEKSDLPKKVTRKKSDSLKSGEDFFSLSREQSISEDKRDDDTQIISESELASFASARSYGKLKSKSSKQSIEDGRESSETKTILHKVDSKETTEVHTEIKELQSEVKEVKSEIKETEQKRAETETPIMKPKRERRNSRSSRRSSSGSEKSYSKAREELLQVKAEVEPKPKMTDEEFKTKVTEISSSISKAINDVQIIERDIILKSELMSSAATASRSLEIICSLITPLSEIHSIADAAKESKLSKEVSTIFNSLPQSLKTLHQSLTLVEKCIDMEGENKTLVKKTCVAFIETCGNEIQKVMSDINSVTVTDYLQADESIIKELQTLTKEMTNVIKYSSDTIKTRNLLSEASEIKSEETSIEKKHLKDTQKAVFELRSPLNSLLCIAESADSGKIIDTLKIKNSEVILNDMSASIQDLQAALEQIESLSVKESTTSLNKYNTEIIETVMDSVLKLRISFEHLSTETKSEDNRAVLKTALTSIKQNLSEISSHIDKIESNIGQFDILQSDNKLEVLQKMAQILIALENNLPRLETLPDVKSHLDVFHKNLTKVLENVIETNEAKKYFALIEICDVVNRVNAAIKTIDSDSILSLASLNNTLRIVQDHFVDIVFDSELNCAILSNIADVLVDIQEAINQAEEISVHIDSEHIATQDLSSYETSKANIALERIEHTIAAIGKVKSLECTKELKDAITPVLENVRPVLEELKRSIASIALGRIVQDETVSEMSDAKSMAQTLATPLCDLYQNIVVINQTIVEHIDSLKENSEVFVTVAEPLHELHITLETLQQMVISQYGEDVAPYEVSVNMANAVQNLQSCIVMIREQGGIETADEMSTLEDISGIKTTAETLPSHRLVLPEAAETTAEQVITSLHQDVPASATAQALQSLNDHITVLQNPDIIDALDTLSEVSDYSSLKSIVLGLGDLHSGIQEILHPFILETSDEMPHINTSKLMAVAEPMQDLQQCLSVLDATNIPIYEHILEMTTDKIHFVFQSITAFKENLDKCIHTVFPAMETADKTIEISNKVETLRTVCEHLKDIIENTKAISTETPVKQEVIALEEKVNNLLDATDVSKGIKIDQVKSVTQELYEDVVIVQEELIQFTPQAPEKLAQEAKLIQIVDKVERTIAVLEEYDFVDLSRASDMSCASLQIALEIETDSLLQMDDVVQCAVGIIQDSSDETPEADLMIVEDFFKNCKNEFALLRCLLTKKLSHKRIIRLLQEFNALKQTVKDFKIKQNELHLAADIKNSLKTFFGYCDECLSSVQESVIKIVDSQSNLLFKAPIMKLDTTKEVLSVILATNKFTPLEDVARRFVTIIEIAKPCLLRAESIIHEEIKQNASVVEDKALLAAMDDAETYIEEQILTKSELTVESREILQKVLDCIQKHHDYKDAVGTGKTLILLKCLAECSDILQENMSESKPELKDHRFEDTVLKVVLAEMLVPLQALHHQLLNVQEQVLTSVDDEVTSVDLTSTESFAQAMGDIQQEIKHLEQHVLEGTVVDSDEKTMIMELDKEIHIIQDSIRSIENVTSEDKEKFTKPIEEIEKSLQTLLAVESKAAAKGETLDLLQNAEKCIALIEKVEEISTLIKIDNVAESAKLAKELRESVASTQTKTLEVTKELSKEIKESIQTQASLAMQLKDSLTSIQMQVIESVKNIEPELKQQVILQIAQAVERLQDFVKIDITEIKSEIEPAEILGETVKTAPTDITKEGNTSEITITKTKHIKEQKAESLTISKVEAETLDKISDVEKNAQPVKVKPQMKVAEDEGVIKEVVDVIHVASESVLTQKMDAAEEIKSVPVIDETFEIITTEQLSTIETCVSIIVEGKTDEKDVTEAESAKKAEEINDEGVITDEKETTVAHMIELVQRIDEYLNQDLENTDVAGDLAEITKTVSVAKELRKNLTVAETSKQVELMKELHALVYEQLTNINADSEQLNNAVHLCESLDNAINISQIVIDKGEKVEDVTEASEEISQDAVLLPHESLVKEISKDSIVDVIISQKVVTDILNEEEVIESISGLNLEQSQAVVPEDTADKKEIKVVDIEPDSVDTIEKASSETQAEERHKSVPAEDEKEVTTKDKIEEGIIEVTEIKQEVKEELKVCQEEIKPETEEETTFKTAKVVLSEPLAAQTIEIVETMKEGIVILDSNEGLSLKKSTKVTASIERKVVTELSDTENLHQEEIAESSSPLVEVEGIYAEIKEEKKKYILSETQNIEVLIDDQQKTEEKSCFKEPDEKPIEIQQLETLHVVEESDKNVEEVSSSLKDVPDEEVIALKSSDITEGVSEEIHDLITEEIGKRRQSIEIKQVTEETLIAPDLIEIKKEDTANLPEVQEVAEKIEKNATKINTTTVGEKALTVSMGTLMNHIEKYVSETVTDTVSKLSEIVQSEAMAQSITIAKEVHKDFINVEKLEDIENKTIEKVILLEKLHNAIIVLQVYTNNATEELKSKLGQDLLVLAEVATQLTADLDAIVSHAKETLAEKAEKSLRIEALAQSSTAKGIVEDSIKKKNSKELLQSGKVDNKNFSGQTIFQGKSEIASLSSYGITEPKISQETPVPTDKVSIDEVASLELLTSTVGEATEKLAAILTQSIKEEELQKLKSFNENKLFKSIESVIKVETQHSSIVKAVQTENFASAIEAKELNDVIKPLETLSQHLNEYMTEITHTKQYIPINAEIIEDSLQMANDLIMIIADIDAVVEDYGKDSVLTDLDANIDMQRTNVIENIDESDIKKEVIVTNIDVLQDVQKDISELTQNIDSKHKAHLLAEKLKIAVNFIETCALENIIGNPKLFRLAAVVTSLKTDLEEIDLASLTKAPDIVLDDLTKPEQSSPINVTNVLDTINYEEYNISENNEFMVDTSTISENTVNKEHINVISVNVDSATDLFEDAIPIEGSTVFETTIDKEQVVVEAPITLDTTTDLFEDAFSIDTPTVLNNDARREEIIIATPTVLETIDDVKPMETMKLSTVLEITSDKVQAESTTANVSASITENNTGEVDTRIVSEINIKQEVCMVFPSIVDTSCNLTEGITDIETLKTIFDHAQADIETITILGLPTVSTIALDQIADKVLDTSVTCEAVVETNTIEDTQKAILVEMPVTVENTSDFEMLNKEYPTAVQLEQGSILENIVHECSSVSILEQNADEKTLTVPETAASDQVATIDTPTTSDKNTEMLKNVEERPLTTHEHEVISYLLETPQAQTELVTESSLSDKTTDITVVSIDKDHADTNMATYLQTDIDVAHAAITQTSDVLESTCNILELETPTVSQININEEQFKVESPIVIQSIDDTKQVDELPTCDVSESVPNLLKTASMTKTTIDATQFVVESPNVLESTCTLENVHAKEVQSIMEVTSDQLKKISITETPTFSDSIIDKELTIVELQNISTPTGLLQVPSFQEAEISETVTGVLETPTLTNFVKSSEQNVIDSPSDSYSTEYLDQVVVTEISDIMESSTEFSENVPFIPGINAIESTSIKNHASIESQTSQQTGSNVDEVSVIPSGVSETRTDLLQIASENNTPSESDMIITSEVVVEDSLSDLQCGTNLYQSVDLKTNSEMSKDLSLAEKTTIIESLVSKDEIVVESPTVLQSSFDIEEVSAKQVSAIAGTKTNLPEVTDTTFALEQTVVESFSILQCATGLNEFVLQETSDILETTTDFSKTIPFVKKPTITIITTEEIVLESPTVFQSTTDGKEMQVTEIPGAEITRDMLKNVSAIEISGTSDIVIDKKHVKKSVVEESLLDNNIKKLQVVMERPTSVIGEENIVTEPTEETLQPQIVTPTATTNLENTELTTPVEIWEIMKEKDVHKAIETVTLVQHIDELTSAPVAETVEVLSKIIDVSEFKESIAVAQELKDSFNKVQQITIDNASLEHATLVKKLQGALEAFQAIIVENTESIAENLDQTEWSKVNKAVTHLQHDLAKATITETLTEMSGESMEHLETLLQEVNDKILYIDRSSDDTESLRNCLDEIQTVIIKLKRDYDGASNDTLNETLEDLECSVRSVQLQINEDSPPELLKEACATLQLLVNNMSATKDITGTVVKEVEPHRLLRICSSETEETVKLLDMAIESKGDLSKIIDNLNILRNVMTLLRNNFLTDEDTIIDKGVEVMHSLDQLEDKVFALEKDIGDVPETVRERILIAMHSVFGSISNMRGTVQSIQKIYMYDNYGKPSKDVLKAIKNVNDKDWKTFSKSLRKVLNHFEDIKFYINLDKTARLPSDAAFTKIILNELKISINEAVKRYSEDKPKVATAYLATVNGIESNLNKIESMTTLEVKQKIPIFKEVATLLIKMTDAIATSTDNECAIVEKSDLDIEIDTILKEKQMNEVEEAIPEENIPRSESSSCTKITEVEILQEISTGTETELQLSEKPIIQDNLVDVGIFFTETETSLDEKIIAEVLPQTTTEESINYIAKISVTEEVEGEADVKAVAVEMPQKLLEKEMFKELADFEQTQEAIHSPEETQQLKTIKDDKITSSEPQPSTSKQENSIKAKLKEEATSESAEVLSTEPDSAIKQDKEDSNTGDKDKKKKSSKETTSDLEKKKPIEQKQIEDTRDKKSDEKDDKSLVHDTNSISQESLIKTEKQDIILKSEQDKKQQTEEQVKKEEILEQTETKEIDHLVKLTTEQKAEKVQSTPSEPREETEKESKLKTTKLGKLQKEEEENRVRLQREDTESIVSEQGNQSLNEEVELQTQQSEVEVKMIQENKEIELKEVKMEIEAKMTEHQKEEEQSKLDHEQEEKTASDQTINEEKRMLQIMQSDNEAKLKGKQGQESKHEEDKDAVAKHKFKGQKEHKISQEKQKDETQLLEETEKREPILTKEKEVDAKLKLKEQAEKDAKLLKDMHENELKAKRKNGPKEKNAKLEILENEKEGILSQKIEQETKSNQETKAKLQKEQDETKSRLKMDQGKKDIMLQVEESKAKLIKEQGNIGTEQTSQKEMKSEQIQEKKEDETFNEKEKNDGKPKTEEEKNKVEQKEEENNAILKKEMAKHEAKLKKETEETDDKVKNDQIDLETELKKKKKQEKAKLSNEKEEKEAKLNQEKEVTKLKKEKEEKESKFKKEQEKHEARIKDEEKENNLMIETEEKEAKLRQGEKQTLAKLKKEKEDMETNLKKENEKVEERLLNDKTQEEAKLKKEREEEEAKIKKEKDEEEARLMKEKEEKQAKLKKKKDGEEVNIKKEEAKKAAKLKKEQENNESKLNKKKEEKEAKVKKESEEKEAKLKNEQEEKDAKLKTENEEEEARILKEKIEKEEKLKKEQEEQIAKLKRKKEDKFQLQKEKEEKVAKLKMEEGEQEAKLKKENEEKEAKLLEEHEKHEAKLKKEKEEEEANLKKEKADKKAKLKKEKDEKEAMLKKDKEERELKLNKKKEEEEAKIIKKKQEKEAKLKKDQEDNEAKIKKEKEEEEKRLRKEKEDKEAKLKIEKEEMEAKLKKETEDKEATIIKQKEEAEAKLKKEKENNDAKIKRDKEEKEAALKKENEGQEAKLKKEKEEKMAKLKIEQEENETKLKKEKDEKENESKLKKENKIKKENEEKIAKLKKEKEEHAKLKKEKEEKEARLQNELEEKEKVELETKQRKDQNDTKLNKERQEKDETLKKEQKEKETETLKHKDDTETKEKKTKNKKKTENGPDDTFKYEKAVTDKSRQTTSISTEEKEILENTYKKTEGKTRKPESEVETRKKRVSSLEKDTDISIKGRRRENGDMKEKTIKEDQDVRSYRERKVNEWVQSDFRLQGDDLTHKYEHTSRDYAPESHLHYHRDDDRHRFVEHSTRDYTSEFARPSNYREKTYQSDDYHVNAAKKGITIYKAQTLVLDAELRSSVPPPRLESTSRKSEPTERRLDLKHKTKAVSEARSILSEKRSSMPRDVRRKPVFSTYLTDRTAVEGSRVKLTCSVLSSAEPTITWYKNGVLIENKFKYRTKFVDGLVTLEVLNAVPADSAEYNCTVENENGSVSTTAILKVYPSFEASPIPPTFTRSIRDTYHLAENELVLECRIRGQPLPTISWLKDDQPVVSNDRYQAYYLADGVCRLAISAPTPEDSGKYTCKAENSVWSDQITHVVSFTGKETHLSPNIQTIERTRFTRQAMESRRPHFTNVLTDYKVARGGTIGLQVEIRGCPTRVEWLREGKSVTDIYKNAKTFVEQGLYTLALSDVTEKESGLYTCRAWSMHGNVDMNAAITVVHPAELDGKPAIIAGRPEKDVLISVGEDLNISFRVQGEPKPKVVFMKGTRDITNSQRVCKMTSDDYVKFTVKRSVISDAGTYCILARNAYGCDRAFVTVVVRQRASSDTLISDWTYPLDDSAISMGSRNYDTVPRIPSEPSVVDGGDNWVSLAWPKPDTTTPVLAYKIESWLLGKEGGARWSELGITPRNTFDVFNLKQGEQYHFRVTLRNRHGWGESVQTSTPIGIGVVGDRPEFAEILPGQLKVLIGQTANLSCSVKGKPIPEVVWMKNGHEIEEDPRMRSSFNGYNCSLVINDIRVEDEARYSCEATNEHGRSSTYARLAVVTDRLVWEADAKLKRERSSEVPGDYPPQFTMRLRDRRVQATYPVRLTCQVVGCPTPTVTWYKDGEEVYKDNRHTHFKDELFHTLEIAPTTLEDGGVYSCTARNSGGAVSCRCSLVVDKGIRAYVAPELCCGLEPLYRLREGDELRISAVVEAYPSVGVTWYRDGVRLRPSRRTVMTLDRDGQIELALAFVTSRDAGVYTCTASNEVGSASTSGKVEVIEGPVVERRAPPTLVGPDVPYSKEPMFIRKPRSSEAYEGDTVIIECEVIGDPKPDVYWLRDFLKPDYYRDASHFKRVGAGPEYHFEIPHAKLDYTGAYSVVAKNVHGEAKAIISLQILAKDLSSTDDSHNIRYGRVDVIPRFERNLNDLLSYDGDAVEFECRVSGNPEPDIRWYHYAELIRDCPYLECAFEEGTARLKIKQVTADDEGTYTCEASNNLGKASTSACLVVYPPGEPNTLSQRLRRPPALLSAASTPRSTPRSTPARSVSRTRTPGLEMKRLCSPSRQMPPSFYTYPFNKVVEEGETVVFQCAVKGFPSPWATWDKDGVIVTPSTRITIKEKEEIRMLEIEQVTIEDVGLYRICVENDYGRAEGSARLEVITLKGKFYAGVRAYSASPRRSAPYRKRYPSNSKD